MLFFIQKVASLVIIATFALPKWVNVQFVTVMKTRDLIIESALAVFSAKGYEGAKMREIADAADINKGLLHYYFKSKASLFEEVFAKIFESITPQLNDVFEGEIPLFDKIEKFVDRYVDVLIKYPFMLSHVLCEINRDPSVLINRLRGKDARPNPISLLIHMQKEHEQGNIFVDNPMQLLMSIVSMCAFPFVARPVMQIILSLDNSEFDYLMVQRKAWITHFVINGIQIKK